MSINKSQKGFNLVELLVAMVLGLFVMSGVFQIFVSSKHSNTLLQAEAEMQENARFAFSVMTEIIQEAGNFGLEKIFTLTYQAGFFRKQGFADIDKSQLPHKIWSDCLNCTKFPDCDEEALQCSVSAVLNR